METQHDEDVGGSASLSEGEKEQATSIAALPKTNTITSLASECLAEPNKTEIIDTSVTETATTEVPPTVYGIKPTTSASDAVMAPVPVSQLFNNNDEDAQYSYMCGGNPDDPTIQPVKAILEQSFETKVTAESSQTRYIKIEESPGQELFMLTRPGVLSLLADCQLWDEAVHALLFSYTQAGQIVVPKSGIHVGVIHPIKFQIWQFGGEMRTDLNGEDELFISIVNTGAQHWVAVFVDISINTVTVIDTIDSGVVSKKETKENVTGLLNSFAQAVDASPKWSQWSQQHQWNFEWLYAPQQFQTSNDCGFRAIRNAVDYAKYGLLRPNIDIIAERCHSAERIRRLAAQDSQIWGEDILPALYPAP